MYVKITLDYYSAWQGQIKTKLGLVLLPIKGPILFFGIKNRPRGPRLQLVTQTHFTKRSNLHTKKTYKPSSMVQFEIIIKLNTITANVWSLE